MFLVYAIFGLIGYNFFAWVLASFSSSSLLMAGGFISICVALGVIGALWGNNNQVVTFNNQR